MSYARRNDSKRASADMTRIYASGGFKNVYKGVYTEGAREGQECVTKIFKTGSVFHDSYFESELKVVAKAMEIINQWNRDAVINKSILLNEPAVWSFEKDGEMCLCEPMISNFEKFNSNTGWTPNKSSPWIDGTEFLTLVMQALSHYSYHSTQGMFLFCDLQGGVYKDGFVITDPVIISTTGDFGPTDLGKEGISTFFARHRCNEYCKSHWKTPIDKNVYFQVQKGSAMILPTRRSRTPLTKMSSLAE